MGAAGDRERLRGAPEVIDCRGSGTDRGLAHGEQARSLIRVAIARWENATLSGTSGATDILGYAAGFLASTKLMAALDNSRPDLTDEIRGIATGAGLPFEVIAAYNLMDEQWWYDTESSPAAPPGCSLVGRTDGRHTLLAQNMDLPGFMDGGQVVLRVRAPGDPEMLLLSSAGIVGLAGVNRAGVAVCVNALPTLNHNRAGLPVVAAIRCALQAENAVGALATLRATNHASGQHYAVADRTRVAGLECSAAGCHVVDRSEPPGLLAHTNHPIVSDDVDVPTRARWMASGCHTDSRARLAILQQYLAIATGRGEVMALLSDRSTPICVDHSDRRPVETFGSVLFAMDDETTAAFCLGKPGHAPWRDIAFSAHA